MDIKVPDISARELLLHPMNLLHQVSTCVIPGVLVLFLLMLKHSSLVALSLSATGMLGYKSRLVLALLISFIVGRVVQSAALVMMKLCGALCRLAANSQQAKQSAVEKVRPPQNADSTIDTLIASELLLPNADQREKSEAALSKVKSTKLTQEQKVTRAFFTSVLTGTVLTSDGSAFDSWESTRSHLGLMLGSGFVLLIASAYPGDSLRVQELIGGFFLVASATIEARNLEMKRVAVIGSALGQVIATHSV